MTDRWPDELASQTPGVYALDPKGTPRLVHTYVTDDYALDDIPEFFRLGQLEHNAPTGYTRLTLSPNELRELKVYADAYSFDFAEGFIEMCLSMSRCANDRPAETIAFLAHA